MRISIGHLLRNSIRGALKEERSIFWQKVAFPITLIAAICYLPSLILRPLFIPDEVRYAAIPLEMSETGNWAVPHFVGLKYFEKPVLGYWLNTISIEIFGRNEFAVRLPGFLAMLGVAFIISVLVLKVRKDYEVARYTGIAYVLCGLVFGLGTLNILDNLFSFFVAASIASFFFGSVTSGKHRLLWVLGAGVASGLAVMTKGFLGVVFPIAVLGPYLLWSGILLEFLPLCFLTVIIAGLVVVPWGLVVNAKDPNFWNYFFWEEHVRRFASSEAQHPEAWWFFIPILILGLVPWLLFAPAVFSGIKKTPRDSLNRLIYCWAIFPFLLVSASRGKLPTYILPCFAPIMLWGCEGLFAYIRAGGTKALEVGSRIFSALCLIILLTLIVIQSGLTKAPPVFELPAERINLIISITSLICFVFITYRADFKKNAMQGLRVFSLCPIIFYICTSIVIPNQFIEKRAPGADLLSAATSFSSETTLISDFRLAASIGWYLKRRDFYIALDGNELSYGLNQPEGQRRWLKDAKAISNLVQSENSKGKDVVLVMREQRWKNFSDSVPETNRKKIFGGVLVLYYPPTDPVS